MSSSSNSLAVKEGRGKCEVQTQLQQGRWDPLSSELRPAMGLGTHGNLGSVGPGVPGVPDSAAAA